MKLISESFARAYTNAVSPGHFFIGPFLAESTAESGLQRSEILDLLEDDDLQTELAQASELNELMSIFKAWRKKNTATAAKAATSGSRSVVGNDPAKRADYLQLKINSKKDKTYAGYNDAKKERDRASNQKIAASASARKSIEKRNSSGFKGETNKSNPKAALEAMKKKAAAEKTSARHDSDARSAKSKFSRFDDRKNRAQTKMDANSIQWHKDHKNDTRLQRAKRTMNIEQIQHLVVKFLK